MFFLNPGAEILHQGLCGFVGQSDPADLKSKVRGTGHRLCEEFLFGILFTDTILTFQKFPSFLRFWSSRFCLELIVYFCVTAWWHQSLPAPPLIPTIQDLSVSKLHHDQRLRPTRPHYWLFWGEEVAGWRASIERLGEAQFRKEGHQLETAAKQNRVLTSSASSRKLIIYKIQMHKLSRFYNGRGFFSPQNIKC